MYQLGNIRVRPTLRRLWSRIRPGIAILGYHRIHDGEADPLGLSTSSTRFAAHLETIRRFALPIRLADAVIAMNDGHIPKRSIVVTFDDGYSDMLHAALPLLERHDVPATMFVTSGNRGGEFWWDRLARQRAQEPDQVIFETANRMQRLSSQQRNAELELRTPQLAVDSQPWHRTLTEPELQTLASHSLIEVGAHTVTHPVLPTLPLAAQCEEINQSRRQLEQLLGRPVESFAYPHGMVTPQTVRIVADAGFRAACASHQDVARANTSVLQLPRLWPANSDGATFEHWLRGWVHG
jgi:peptidoglycan/xylan/chitin deacetylase (PgdA/CDA1 family)